MSQALVLSPREVLVGDVVTPTSGVYEGVRCRVVALGPPELYGGYHSLRVVPAEPFTIVWLLAPTQSIEVSRGS